jgi:hypothetical protein
MVNQSGMLNKTLVIGVFFLFVGLSVTSSISQEIKNKSIKEILTGDPPEEEWNTTFGGPDYDDGYSVQQTNDEGYIITGFTNSFGAGNWDAWLIKTDINGSEEWNTTFGGVDYDRGYIVQQTNDSGYIIIGCTYSFGAGSFDVWLIKTDSDGIEEWNRTFGGTSVDWGYFVQQTKDGGYIITGYTESYGAGESDVFLIKTNSGGYEEWNRTFGGNINDRGYSVQQTNDDGYILTGFTASYDEDYTGVDVWLIKTDSFGKKEWHQTFGGTGITNKVDMGYSVKQTKDGGYILTGDTEIIFVAESDIFLIKTDSDGNEEWNQTFGGPYTDRGRFVDQTKEGGYIIAGSISSLYTKDSDVCLIKTNSSGYKDWYVTFGFAENSSDWGYSVQQTNDNGYIISGATMPNGWKNEESSKSYTVEGTNVWLIKVAGENLPPDIPDIDGPNSGKPNTNYDFTFNSTDPDGDDIDEYIVTWGDDTGDETISGPFASGVEITGNHTWTNDGTYTIKAKAKDVYGGESQWTEFKITIPRNRATSNLWYHCFLERFPLLERLLDLLRI